MRMIYYRFSHKDFGLCSQIKIRPQRTIVRLRIILIWRLAKIFMTKSVESRSKDQEPPINEVRPEVPGNNQSNVYW